VGEAWDEWGKEVGMVKKVWKRRIVSELEPRMLLSH
jgi:hypothetical protein